LAFGLVLSAALAPVCNAQWTWSGNGANTTAQPSLWLEPSGAADGITPNGSGGVSAWQDGRSGFSSLSVSDNGTAANDPTLVTGALNGHNVVRFDGVNNILYNTSISSSIFGASDSTTFVVQTFNGTSSDLSATVSWVAPGANPDQVIVNATYQDQLFYTHGKGNDYIGANAPLGFAGSAHVLTFERNGGTGILDVDGVAQDTTGSPGFSTSLTASSGTLAVGGVFQNSTKGQLFNGDVAEVIVFNTALSGSDVQTVEQYLGNKYNISVVPEPSQYATVFGLLCVGGAVFLKRRRPVRCA
jgi:hypothetical protein